MSQDPAGQFVYVVVQDEANNQANMFILNA